jgi:hypothetical protein
MIMATYRTIIAAGILILLGAVVGVGLTGSDKLSSAPSGLPATQRIATTTVVGPQSVTTIFANKASCASRVISTTDGTNQEILVIFGNPTNGDIATPTGIVGHAQAGSTTVAYDSGIYGCGAWEAYATASTTLLLSELY